MKELDISYVSANVFERAMIHPWHINLVKVVSWLPSVMDRIVCTGSYRPLKIYGNDSGIHGQIPLRALDFRSRFYVRPGNIESVINRMWVYDPLRPHLQVCVYHNTGRGYHFHVQIHENTVTRKGVT